MTNPATTLTTAMDAIKSLGDSGRDFNMRSMTSLPEFTKPLLLESPCFIQSTLAEEPVCGDIIKNLYNVYVGYVLCALQMDQLVIGDRKVRDMIAPVSTAGSFEQYIDTESLVSGLSGSVEGTGPDTLEREQIRREKRRERQEIRKERHEDRKIENDEKLVDKAREKSEKEYDRVRDKAEQEKERVRTRAEREGDRLRDKTEESEKLIANAGMTGSNHNLKDSLSLPLATGRQIEVTFSTGTGGKISVMLNVKFNPRFIPEKVVEVILGQEVSQEYSSASLSKRWLQYRAGEISFIKDFVFGIDRLNRRATALKKDTDHALADIFRHKSKSSFKRMLNLSGSQKNRSYNLANSILMIEDETATRCSRKDGFNFNNFKDRQKLFDNTYNLFIVLVDNRYSRVNIYTNGIEQSGTYSFNDLKASASSDKMSLKDMMEYMSKGQMPKF